MAAEASFLAVLLRLMSFMVPSLHLLASYEPDAGERLSAMGQMMLEAFGDHPVVFTEAMAFFEQLSLHTSLLPHPAAFLRPSEDYLTSCLPYLFQALTPDHPVLLADRNWLSRPGILSSIRGSRVAVLSAKLLAVNGVLVPGRYVGDLPAALFSQLEVSCGRRIFVGENLYRAVASSRRADISVYDHRVIEAEVTEAIDAVLLTEAKSGATMLHWILFTRCLLTGSVEKSDGIDSEEFTRARAKAVAKARASESALLVFEFAVPVRWQTRCQAARSATLALKSLSNESDVGLKRGPHFDSLIANDVFAEQVKELRASQSQTSKLQSFVVFHAGEIVSAACSSAMATLDQSELWHVQEGGIRLLTEIIFCIGDAEDLDDPGHILLEEYMSQVISCVKHGLVAFLEDDEDDAEKLFMLGCEALQSVVQNKLITDAVVLKRLVKPVLLSQSDVTFFGYENTPDRNWLPSEEDTSYKNFRLSLLPILGKLWSLGQLRGFVEDNILPKSVAEELLKEVSSSTVELAAYSAAVAIDGSRFLRGSGLTLAGMPRGDSKDQSAGDNIAFDSGFLFDDVHDLDELVKIALIKAWPACVANCMYTLVDVLQDEDTDEVIRAACSKWLENVTPVVFAALRDSFAVFPKDSSDEQRQADFAKGISTDEVIASSLRGLCALLRRATVQEDLLASSASEMAFVVSRVANLILFPVSGIETSCDDTSSMKGEEGKDESSSQALEAELSRSISQGLVTESCLFIEALAASDALCDEVESAFLMTILPILDAVQKNEVSVENPLVSDIVASCLSATQQFIKRGHAKKTLVNAMVQLSIDVLSSMDTFPESTVQVAKLLMAECLNDEAVSDMARSTLAREMAAEGKWEPWILTCAPPAGVAALSQSLSVVKVALSDLHSSRAHLPALSAVRRVISEVVPPNDVVAIMMGGVGAQVLGLLQSYGTLSIPDKDAVDHRLTSFADCMKVIMAAYQNLVATSTDDSQMAAFLSVVFEVWTAVIQFNGLPNQPSPNSRADPTLGRLSAQAIVHVARSSPVAFKTSVAGLSDHGRALLEFSVRAEMNGYAAAPTQAPVKKKLSLKGFKK